MNTLLLSILSLVMTWTVETKSTVSFSGDAPAAIDVEYVCSYQKGTVRSGDDATLTLTGTKVLSLVLADRAVDRMIVSLSPPCMA